MELNEIITKDDLQVALSELSAQEELLYKDGLKMETARKTRDEFEKMRTKLESYASLVATIAFKPKGDDLVKLHKLFETLGFKDFYLDVSTDAGMVAGIKFAFNGKYYDYSVLSAFDKYWETKRYDLI